MPQTVEKTVTQVIEQQLTGIDHLMYFSSTSSANGGSSVTLTFEPGTNPDIAQVQTQNKVALATPRLPTEVVQQGVTAVKSNPDFLMFMMLKDDDRQAQLVRAEQPAVAPASSTRSRACMASATRSSSAPNTRCASGSMPTSCTATACRRRRRWPRCARRTCRSRPARSARSRPRPAGGFTATVVAEGRFTQPEQFENIILRANADGTAVRLKDVARVELGPFSYGQRVVNNGQGVAGLGVQLVSGANALTVANEVRDKMNRAAADVPAGRVVVDPVRHDAVHQDLDRGSRQDAGRGDRARVPRHADVPAELPRHDHRDAGDPGRADGRLSSACGRSASRSTSCRCSAWCSRSASSSTMRSS